MAFVGSAVFGGKDLGRVQKNVRIQSMGAYMVSPGIQIGKPKTQIGKPKTNIGGGSTSTEVEQQAKKQRPKPKYKTDADEIPMYKVILLGDEGYDEVHVTTQLMKIIPKFTSDEASRVFREAQNTGSSIVCVVNKEHAEFYAQQLRRQEIFVVVEEDK
mmetsp:Transcript_43787/g.171286  ORF Transcript_43787/g.171286 Transcript_43787/m.171286 type:complete len:158 (-) Transcript_43787:1888-2361(-)|eukprot:CAMPEP_0113961882 /NCGR_PEP_ID=MMETSP0011_2-20120614/5584_1 /TAXON_ID=101924 /ORGANISM="Rhodosorus marinus" /LENGTH=157 /DNA_ID=CAMNT_0000973629 /DNA_START=159 /DNA_END=632 /DNA_ORIENTATION=- /assembly_acc=CAM_ASM_000156